MLKGFPTSNQLDHISGYSEQNTRSLSLAVVGFAGKGPVNTPIKINNLQQLRTTLGFPEADSYLIYAVEQYLAVGSEVFVYRAVDKATTATIPIPGANNLVRTHSTVKEPYTFKTNQFFRWRLDGILSSKTLVVLATDEEGITAEQLASELNDQLNSKDGIEFYGKDYISVRTTKTSKSELELVSVQDAMYGPWGATGLGSEMEPAIIVGSKEPYDFNNLECVTLQLIIGGSKNITVDDNVQTINLSSFAGKICAAEDVADYINKVELPLLPGGWKAFARNETLGFRTNHSGRDASILIKPGRVANKIFGFSTQEAKGKSPKDGAIFLSTQENEDISFTITADSPGVSGNNTRVDIVNEPDSNTFTLKIYHDGVQVESWGQLTKDKTNRFYVESFINLVSDWIKVIDNKNNNMPPKNGSYNIGDERIVGSVKGTNGVNNEKLITNGIYTFIDNNIDIDIITAPGFSSQEVIKTLNDVCKERKDCIFLVDPPMELDAVSAAEWAEDYKMDLGASFWPWVKIRDTYNRNNVWVPPSIAAITAITRSDSLSSPWMPPVGATRGITPGVLDVFYTEDRKIIEKSNINPICHYLGPDSFALCGQKTLGGNGINVIRLMFYIEKRIRKFINSRTLEFGNKEFRERFVAVSEHVLSLVKNGRGIHSYTIQVDESRAKIGVQSKESGTMYINFHREGEMDNLNKETHGYNSTD